MASEFKEAEHVTAADAGQGPSPLAVESYSLSTPPVHKITVDATVPDTRILPVAEVPGGDKAVAVGNDKAEKSKEEQRAADDLAAERILKNPAVFASVVKAAYRHWHKNGWGDVEKDEVARVAHDESVDPLERGAANVLDKNFSLFAGLYGSRKVLETGDIDEFSSALKLNQCGVPLSLEAAATAAKWGIGTYGVSKMFGSDQSGENAAVAATSSLLASLLLAAVESRNKADIKQLNYFDIPDC